MASSEREASEQVNAPNDSEGTPHISIFVEDASEDERHDSDHEISDQQKKMKRILANRSSARASYLRRKKMVVEIQETVSELSKRNDRLEAENKQLRAEVKNLRLEINILLGQVRSSTSFVANEGSNAFGVDLPGLVGTGASENPTKGSQSIDDFVALDETRIDAVTMMRNHQLVRLLAGLPPHSFGL